MGFFGGLASIFGAGALQTAGVLALDVFSALINGPKPRLSPDLKNKSYRSDAYGTVFTRCRGVVRNQGKVIYGSNIRTSIWKTTSGGIFGIGQQSVYYNKYSISLAIAFGKKLGGGAAQAILRIWADGKFLFNAVPSSSSIVGSVVTTTVTPFGQPIGQMYLLVNVPSGGSLSLNAGDYITIPADPNFGYQVQVPVNVTGPATGVAISIWPPLRVNVTGGGLLTIQGLNAPPYDLSSFDPNPHDGSHFSGGYNCPPGGIRFYLGSSSQQPDPTMVQALGVGNVPGYTNTVYVMIHDLQLINYGDHPPQITSEIAYDTPSYSYPEIGPITYLGISGSYSVQNIMIPNSGPSALSFENPLTAPPYVFLLGSDSTNWKIERINRITNVAEAYANATPGGNIVSQGGCDWNCFIWYVAAAALNNWHLYKFDGLTMNIVADYGPATSGPSNHEHNVGAPVGGSWIGGCTPWEMQASFFGNAVLVEMMAYLGAGTGWVFEATTNLPFGTQDCSGINQEPIVIGWDKNGNPIVFTGTTTSSFTSPADVAWCIDGDGDLWVQNGDALIHFDCQPQSSVLITCQGTPMPYLAPPSFNQTSYSIAALSSNTPHELDICYDAATNSIFVVGDIAVGRVDVNTGNVTVITSPPASWSGMGGPDVMNTILGGNGSLQVQRMDLASGQIINAYTVSNWANWTSTGGAYDGSLDSVWFPGSGGLYRMILDRANGLGITIDLIVESLLAEAGYSSGQYNVSSLTSGGDTAYGWEFDRETFLDSLKHMMEYHLFDTAEINAAITCVMRGQAPVMTIPEADMGALADPSKYEPRVDESEEDVLSVPESVWIKHYDPLRNGQESRQYAKRISQPYPSTLAAAKAVSSSRLEEDMVIQLTENATPVQQHADKILWDKWTGRQPRKLKLGYKYIQLDPTDVVTLDYKSGSLETRIEQANLGASLAQEIIGRSQDRSVYSSTYLPSSSGGLGSGAPGPPVQPPTNNNNYTINPTNPLSSPNSTTIDLAAFIATFTSGLRLQYAARVITVADPGAGNQQTYYVTIVDTSFVGDNSTTVPTLSYLVGTTPASVNLGQSGYINCGSVVVLGAGSTTTNPNPGQGGQPPLTSGPQHDTFNGNGSATQFTLSQVPLDGYFQLFLNGIEQSLASLGGPKATLGGTNGDVITTHFVDSSGNPYTAQTGDVIDVYYFA